jgi:hypothetical protein
VLEIIEDDNQDPICPHCDKEFGSILTRMIQSSLGVRYIYFCSHCRKVLGISHRKGFWMG